MYYYTSTYGMSSNPDKTLFSLIASLGSEDEAAALLTSLLTPDELHTLSERWQIITHLLSGETQREVKAKLGVGIATVTRGAREIKYGNGAVQKFAKKLAARHRRHAHSGRS